MVRTFLIPTLFLICLLLYPSEALSQKRKQFEPINHSHYFGYHFDDDFLFFDNRDEQYTGGLEFEYISSIDRVKKKIGLFNPFSMGRRYWTGTFGSYLYTPYNVSDSLIILNDRPFSSYIYSSVGYVAYDPSLQKKLRVTLFLGIMGSPLPGKVQELIHTVGDSPPAFGWENRVARNETFIPNLKVNYEANLWSFGRIKILPIDWIQIGRFFELNTGFYMNNINGGLRIEAFNYTPVTSAKQNFKFRRHGSSQQPKLKLSGFFKPQLQLVAQNTTLQSLPWLNSPYIVTPDLMNRHIWILEGGFNLNIGRFHMNYTIQARSKEFKKYQKDWHSWAGITMGVSF